MVMMKPSTLYYKIHYLWDRGSGLRMGPICPCSKNKSEKIFFSTPIYILNKLNQHGNDVHLGQRKFL